MSEWTTQGVSLTGLGHLAKGRGNDDSFFVASDEDATVLVTCDGAGACSHARFGARAVATTVGKFLLLNAAAVVERKVGGAAILEVALDAINQLAHKHELYPDDFSCTLVAAVLVGDQCMTCHVGDGAIFMLDAERPRCISHPEGKENRTYFVTCAGVMPRMWLHAVPPSVTGFVLTTDGASILYNETTRATHPFVAQLANALDHADASEDMLLQMVISSLQQMTQDDVTVVVARRSYIGGVYGCLFCGAHGVLPCWNKSRTAFFGKCTECRQVVFRYDSGVRQACRGYIERSLSSGLRKEEVKCRFELAERHMSSVRASQNARVAVQLS